MFGLFRKQQNPARELALIGAEKRKREADRARRRIREVAQQMRRGMGLPDDQRLA